MKRYGDTPITETQIRLLLMGMEHRGIDAAGVCIQKEDGTLFVVKDDTPAWRFCSTQVYEKFMKEHSELQDDERVLPDTIAVIVHARAATQGSPRKMENNHPLFAGVSATVHNGCISNEDWVYKELKLDRKGEVDSDIFRAIVDKWGITDDAIKQMNKLSGSAAIAVLDPRSPGKLLIARSGSPLVLGSTPDQFCFASEKHILHRAMRPWTKRFGVDFQFQSLQMAFSPFPDDTAWIMGPNGFESHRKFSTLTGMYRTPTYRVNDNYTERQRKWDAPAPSGTTTTTTVAAVLPEHMTCPNPQCKRLITFTVAQRNSGDPLSHFSCNKDTGGCGTNLATAAAA